VKQHKKALSDTVALIAARPQASPLAQNIGPTRSATPHRLIDPKLYFDNTGGAAFTSDVANRNNLANKDNSSLIRHAMQCIFDRGIGSRRILSKGSRHKQQSKCHVLSDPSNVSHSCVSVPIPSSSAEGGNSAGSGSRAQPKVTLQKDCLCLSVGAQDFSP
jgi:hypothetical protein